jgi:Uma2 family endonuclease
VLLSDRMFDVGLLAPEQPRRLKRDEFWRLVALDVFEDERVELLHGTVVAMSPSYPEHEGPITTLTMRLVPALVGRAIVRVQLSYLAEDDSVPEPDIAIVPPGSYATVHPSRAHLVIEVAASSLRKDRLVKAPLYAASGVEEYWIVNVAERCLEVFRDSTGETYRTTSRHGPDEVVSLVAFPDVAVNVASVFA